jgi:hypothetical protein
MNRASAPDWAEAENGASNEARQSERRLTMKDL